MVRQSLCAGALIVALLACATPAWAGEETVPDVVGLSLDEANALMAQAGFTCTVRYELGKPIGIVFSQDPGSLATRDRFFTEDGRLDYTGVQSLEDLTDLYDRQLDNMDGITGGIVAEGNVIYYAAASGEIAAIRVNGIDLSTKAQVETERD